MLAGARQARRIKEKYLRAGICITSAIVEEPRLLADDSFLNVNVSDVGSIWHTQLSLILTGHSLMPHWTCSAETECGLLRFS